MIKCCGNWEQNLYSSWASCKKHTDSCLNRSYEWFVRIWHIHQWFHIFSYIWAKVFKASHRRVFGLCCCRREHKQHTHPGYYLGYLPLSWPPPAAVIHFLWWHRGLLFFPSFISSHFLFISVTLHRGEEMGLTTAVIFFPSLSICFLALAAEYDIFLFFELL